MKRIYILGFFIFVIITLVLVWVYLVFFDTPESKERLQDNLSFFGTEKNIDSTTENSNSNQNIVDVKNERVRQLTTKPIAGFSEIINSTNTPELPIVYYAESGTGHIYSINLETGEEKRISGTTVVGANSASFSQKGDYVVLANKNNKNYKITIGEIDTENSSLKTQELSVLVDQFKVNQQGTGVYYSTRDKNGLLANSYNFKTKSTEKIFAIPFHEAVIQWGSDPSQAHYFYPKASYLLEGYLYKVKAGKTTRLPADGMALTTLVNNDVISYSNVSTKNIRKSYFYNIKDNSKIDTRFTFLPEKCLLASEGFRMICAWEDRVLPGDFPDTWYKGDLRFRDSLWMIKGDLGEGVLLSDLKKETGREIDVTNISLGKSERVLYFINKNDNTLWMYEM